MDWFIVPRMRPKPTSGIYSDWKVEIFRNCRHQCVYCTISGGEYGGIDNFHIDHFRPKSLFADLKDDIDNLFIACAVCNRFKSDDWPGDPHPQGNTATFLDPSGADYHTHITLSPDARLTGQTVAGLYIVERLYLNRAQLIVSRRYRRALRSLEAATTSFNQTLTELNGFGAEGHEIMQEIAQASVRIINLQSRLATAVPYDAPDIKRPKNTHKKKPKLAGKRKSKKRN